MWCRVCSPVQASCLDPQFREHGRLGCVCAARALLARRAHLLAAPKYGSGLIATPPRFTNLTCLEMPTVPPCRRGVGVGALLCKLWVGTEPITLLLMLMCASLTRLCPFLCHEYDCQLARRPGTCDTVTTRCTFFCLLQTVYVYVSNGGAASQAARPRQRQAPGGPGQGPGDFLQRYLNGPSPAARGSGRAGAHNASGDAPGDAGHASHVSGASQPEDGDKWAAFSGRGNKLGKKET